jgi:hypothetical protein
MTKFRSNSNCQLGDIGIVFVFVFVFVFVDLVVSIVDLIIAEFTGNIILS